MNHLKIYFSFLLLITILSFATGCQNNNSTIVQPNNSGTQTGKALLGSDSPVTQTMLINGDMEDGTNGYWSGGNFSNKSYTFSHSNSESVSPSHSLNINASGTSDGFAYWAQTFDAAAFVGKKLSVTVSTKYQNVKGDGVMLVLRGDNTFQPESSAEAFSSTQRKVVYTGTSDWKTIEVDMDPVPEGIKSLTVYMLISSNSGSVYFDNLNVTTAAASAPLTDLTNGNIESGSSYPDDWQFGSAKSSIFNFAWDTNQYLSANHSLKISSQNSSDQFAFWAQTIEANEFVGKKITLNVNIKAADLVGQGVYIAIRGDNTLIPSGSAEVFATTQGNEQISGTFDWKQLSVTMDNVPTDIKSLTFYLIYGSTTSGTVNFDDISLTKN